MQKQDDLANAQFAIVLTAILAATFVTPLALANNLQGLVGTFLLLAFLFFFPGYALVSFFEHSSGLRIFLSPVFGIVTMVTAYDVCTRLSRGNLFGFVAVSICCAGVFMFVQHVRRTRTQGSRGREDLHDVIAGGIVTLSVAPLYWRSGRFSDGNFVFYGPAGQDPLFHVTLLQRLLHHVPPDNFIVAGLPAPVYHYFDDLTLALIVTAQRTLHLGSADIFDLYYRCYPTLLYFLLGAFAYRAGRELAGKTIGGALGVLVLLGAGGLGWPLGAVQAALHASHPAALRSGLFSEWGPWNGVDEILPLVHRPAHYHSLLICLAALALIVRPELRRRDWMAAGFLLGLMAGFNFTLGATFGFSAVLASLLLWLRNHSEEARKIAWLALFILIGSLPVVLSVILARFHNNAPGFPFRGPNLEFTTGLWGGYLGRILSPKLVPITALFLFPLLAYGIRLVGLQRIMKADLGNPRFSGFAMTLSVVFALSFLIGTFFPYKALGGVAIIFIQPTLWILGLFSLAPLVSWLERKKLGFWPFVVWGLLGIAWLQALGAYNFGRRASFTAKSMDVFREIRASATPDEVVAHLPTNLIENPMLGNGSDSTDFTIMALTGLDGYFSSEAYSTSFAMAGLQGRDDSDALAQALDLYNQRREDVQTFLNGNISETGTERLAKDHVCWVLLSRNSLQEADAGLRPWRRTQDLAVYRLCP